MLGQDFRFIGQALVTTYEPLPEYAWLENGDINIITNHHCMLVWVYFDLLMVSMNPMLPVKMTSTE